MAKRLSFNHEGIKRPVNGDDPHPSYDHVKGHERNNKSDHPPEFMLINCFERASSIPLSPTLLANYSLYPVGTIHLQR